MQAAEDSNLVISAHLDDNCRAVSWIEPDGQYVRIVNGPSVVPAQPARGALLRLAREMTRTEEQRT